MQATKHHKMAPPPDRAFGGYRLFVGDIGTRVGKYDLEREFDRYGPITDVWVARLYIFNYLRVFKFS